PFLHHFHEVLRRKSILIYSSQKTSGIAFCVEIPFFVNLYKHFDLCGKARLLIGNLKRIPEKDCSKCRKAFCGVQTSKQIVRDLWCKTFIF
ncbi:Protein of unknown function, partial [Gryllus bimaculatus]